MERGKIKILYVDDDKSNLEVFKASFRRDYQVNTASSADEGFELLKNLDCHVIIADQKMPGMTGVEFFEKILKEYPDPVRILLTGYTDISSVIDAINKGQVYRYISKPWNEPDLRIAIENAYEIFEMRKRLEITNNELRKRNDELNRFVYSASHEMKAPLMTIMGVLKMAQENKSIDSSQYFSMIEKCANNLQVFIKSVVDYYRNQRYEENLKEINPEVYIKEAIESYMFNAHASEINFNISSSLSHTFVTDEFRFRVILNNILSNSIKYQREDNLDKRVNITLKSNERELELIVSDNGIGIPEEYKKNIFNMFFRATDHGQGSGLGLYIVKEAVDKLKGNIELKSQEGKGSEFRIVLPNRYSELREIPANRPNSANNISI